MACAAAVLFGLGGYVALAAGGLVAQVASVIDGCDGEVARLKRLQSKVGGWFDAALDRYADAFLLLGLSWHSYSVLLDMRVVLVGFAAMIGSFLISYTAGKYEDFVAQGIPGNSAIPIGRDVRTFLIFAGAVSGQPHYVLIVIALLTNLEVVRRIVAGLRTPFADGI